MTPMPEGYPMTPRTVEDAMNAAMTRLGIGPIYGLVVTVDNQPGAHLIGTGDHDYLMTFVSQLGSVREMPGTDGREWTWTDDDLTGVARMIEVA